MNETIRTWIYATRPHTLGASIAPMLILLGSLISEDEMRWGIYLLAFVVAVSAQVVSNIANDYFGYKNGEDSDQRVGFSRLISIGAVSPREMLIALGVALSICVGAGVALVALTTWWLLIIGLLIVVAAVGYSAGQYSLSRLGLGDIAVVLFYGLIPILASFYAISADAPPLYLVLLALGIGIWESNILVCNNYRDYEEDLASGKKTLIVRMGKSSGPLLYLINALLSLLLLFSGLISEGSWIGAIVLGIIALLLYVNGFLAIRRLKGRSLNKLLRYTNIITLIVGIIVMMSLLL